MSDQPRAVGGSSEFNVRCPPAVEVGSVYFAIVEAIREQAIGRAHRQGRAGGVFLVSA